MSTPFSFQIDQGGDQQVLLPECLKDPDHSVLSQEGMVSGPAVSFSGPPKTPATKIATAHTAPLPQVPSRIVSSGPDRLQTVRSLVRAKGFSKLAAEAVARCRKSSSRLYQSKWSVFRGWCRHNNISSSETSISQLADFFLS